MVQRWAWFVLSSCLVFVVVLGAIGWQLGATEPEAWTSTLLPFGEVPQGDVRPVVTALVASEKWLVAAGDDQLVHVWRLPQLQPAACLRGHTGWVRAVALLPDQNSVLSGGDDGRVLIWDLNTGQLRRELTLQIGAIKAIAVGEASPTGTVAAVAGFSGQVAIIRGEDGRLVAQWSGAGPDIRSVAILSEHSAVAVGDRNGVLSFWSLADGQPLTRQAIHRGRMRALVWCREEQVLFTAGEDARVLRCRYRGDLQVETLAVLPSPVHSMICIPEGLVVGSADNAIRVLKPDTGEVVAELAGHKGSVSALAACPAGGFFAAGFDTSIRWWQRSTAVRTVPSN
jgi:WD40 repeat protein